MFMAPCLLLSAAAQPALAFTVDIAKGSDTLYLRVGDGVYSGTYSNGNDPPSGGPMGTLNVVSLTVPAAALGDGTSLPMTANTTQRTSNYDGFVFCNANETYVGGFYRHDKKTGADATLSAAVTLPLTNATGQTIPFSEITWTSSGNGDGASQPFPSGAFSGGVQSLGTFPVNTWQESCHSFSYRNSNFVAAGTYNGRVTYSLSAP